MQTFWNILKTVLLFPFVATIVVLICGLIVLSLPVTMLNGFEKQSRKSK